MQINNKVGFFIAFLIVLAVGNEIYIQINKKPQSAKSKRLQCHKKTITFEKVLKPELVSNLQQTLKSNDYIIDVWADKAKYMKSVMFKFVDIRSIQNDIRDKIKAFPSEKVKSLKINDVFVDVMVYENDKKDPGKKTKRSKLYAGYLEVTFKVDKKVVYKIQTDFMSLKGEDIPERISCIVNSVMSVGE